jgi:hypothetical protein
MSPFSGMEVVPAIVGSGVFAVTSADLFRLSMCALSSSEGSLGISVVELATGASRIVSRRISRQTSSAADSTAIGSSMIPPSTAGCSTS